MSVALVGECSRRIFGMTAADRLRRQNAGGSEQHLVAHASAVLSEGSIQWLRQNRGTLLLSAQGTPLAVVIAGAGEEERANAALCGRPHPFGTVVSGSLEFFNRKLRRREHLFGLSLAETDGLVAHRALFDSVYKGVTDIVTKWVWPEPAFWVTRALAALRIRPNAVTSVGILSMFAAAYLFAGGQIAAGLIAAWLMTFLDTVDGKLARVTVQSSKVGDRLDHWTDIAHPPLWWICLAFGIAEIDHAARFPIIAAGVIVVCYVIGRIVEAHFKTRFGFNQFIWHPFDSCFRLVIARRNTILLIITAGALTGEAYSAYLTAAAWCLMSVAVQSMRYLHAGMQPSISCYLCDKDDTLPLSFSSKARPGDPPAQYSECRQVPGIAAPESETMMSGSAC